MEPERHPWNNGFRFAVPDTPPTTVTEHQRQQFARDGYFVVEGVLSPDERSALIDDLDRIEAGMDQFLASREDGRFTIAEHGAITFSPHAVLQSSAARATARHPRLLGFCRDLLGADVNLYWDQAVYKKTEKPRSFPWHQDTGYNFVEPQAYLTCWLALTDATEANGCPWVVPGAHLAGTLRHRWVDPLGYQCLDGPANAVAAPVAAGGAVVFSSLTPHSTGPNQTSEVRKAYIVQYALAGTCASEGDPDAGPPGRSIPQDDPKRQFAVLRNGEAVEAVGETVGETVDGVAGP
jgi:ectoine hydroxylase-related dioxygenase (phytanoyl-CoA dioxygenase family)